MELTFKEEDGSIINKLTHPFGRIKSGSTLDVSFTNPLGVPCSPIKTINLHLTLLKIDGDFAQELIPTLEKVISVKSAINGIITAYR